MLVSSTIRPAGSATPELTGTEVALAEINLTPTPTVMSGAEPSDAGRFPLEAVIGGLLLLGVIGYVGIYWYNTSQIERFASGFVIQRCPVCNRGDMLVEVRQERWFGVPRGRRIVRCTECRSVLREIGRHRWRYAVDPLENPTLYQRYNGKEIDDRTLLELATRRRLDPPANPRPPTTPPSFVDDDSR